MEVWAVALGEGEHVALSVHDVEGRGVPVVGCPIGAAGPRAGRVSAGRQRLHEARRRVVRHRRHPLRIAPRRHVLERPRLVDERDALAGVLLGVQVLWRRREVRVGDVLVGVRNRQVDHLGHEVDVRRRVVAEGAQVVVLQHVEHQDDARPLAPAGGGVDVVAVEFGPERLLPAALVVREVLVADDAFLLPEETVHGAGRLALVEGVPGGADPVGTASSRRQRLPLGVHQVADEPSQVGVHHEVTQPLLPDPVREPEVAVVGKREDAVPVILDHPLLHLVKVVALLRDAERGLGGLAEADGAEPVERREPDVHVRRNQGVVDGRLAVLEEVVEVASAGEVPAPTRVSTRSSAAL